MGKFDSLVVIITGSSNGIGAHAAKHIAQNGGKVTVNGRTQQKLDRLLERMVRDGVNKDQILLARGDVTKEDEAKRIVDDTVNKFGKIDVLINNAGVHAIGGIQDCSADMFDHVISGNLKSAFLMCKYAVPYLMETKGNIVNLSSLAGTKQYPEILAYCISKAGVDQLTKCLALELGPHKVRVNAVCPVLVLGTDLFANEGVSAEEGIRIEKEQEQYQPLGRNAHLRDTTNAISYLISQDAAFITGQLLYVDGGRSCTDANWLGPKYPQ